MPGAAAINDDWSALKEQVKDASDIVDVVGGYIPLRPAGPTFKGICPFHEDHRPSFDVDPRRQRYKCWACSKVGDVFNFVMEYERVSFVEAMELLARRAGISLEKVKKTHSGPSRASMLDVLGWAQKQFHDCLLDHPLAEAARNYLGERGLTGATVRGFGLGYAPGLGEWLVTKAANDRLDIGLLETVGLIAKRNEGRGYYDRFRDRVLFPIRDLRGQVVGFGGRILPSSPLAATAPKYYNSSETPIFSKSNQLYALDTARTPAGKSGTVAVVEGYMDVLMAHQHGVHNVVAPMGTALTSKHIQKLRGMVKKVVLVFDADAGGSTGVDRALDLFVANELDLRVGLLPEGLDPCDLILKEGGPAFQKVLDDAADVFEFKLRQVWPREGGGTLEEKRIAAEKMLGILAAAPELRSVKMELMVNRIAHRLGLKEETLWNRLRELRERRAAAEPPRDAIAQEEPQEVRSAPAVRHEVELMELLLAEPPLVAKAKDGVSLADIEHAGLRQLLEKLYALSEAGLTPDLDRLRDGMENDRLLDYALKLQDRGLNFTDRPEALDRVLGRFREIRRQRFAGDTASQLRNADSHDQAIELLTRLRDRTP